MEKNIIDERNGWEYELKGKQYYPTGRVMKNSVMTPDMVPEDNNPGKEISIGIWGQRHAEFLKKHQRSVYNEFLVSGKLQTYLAQIDREARRTGGRDRNTQSGKTDRVGSAYEFNP